jgi:thioredoxin 1
MEQEMLEVTDENFEEVVLKNKMPVLVDFWADWCGPCMNMLNTIEEIDEEYHGEVVVVKCNVDECSATASQYGVRSIPFLIFFKEGEPVNTLVGNQTKEKVEIFVEKSLVC